MSNLQLIEKNGTQKVVPKNIQNTKDEKNYSITKIFYYTSINKITIINS